MKEVLPKTLATRVLFLREKNNLSREKLAERSNIDLPTINNIEEGLDTFLSASIRQRLAKTLKISGHTLKEVEQAPIKHTISSEIIEDITNKILANLEEDLHCPVCNSSLVVRILTLYDLKDNPIKYAKARCRQCPFQIK